MQIQPKTSLVVILSKEEVEQEFCGVRGPLCYIAFVALEPSAFSNRSVINVYVNFSLSGGSLLADVFGSLISSTV